MWTWFAKRAINGFAKHYDYDVSYMHQLLAASPGGFRKFSKVAPLAAYRRQLPADVHALAQIAAMQAEDCGPCLQLTVKMAVESGVDPQVLQAALDDGETLSPSLRDVHRFARAVAENELLDDAVVERLESRYGREGMAELALSIAAARIFPTIKRALGHAKSCSTIRIEVPAR